MPKVNIEFLLPDESNEYQIYNHATDFYLSLWDFAQVLRAKLKYDHEYTSADNALEEIKDEFYKCLDSHGINLYNFN